MAFSSSGSESLTSTMPRLRLLDSTWEVSMRNGGLFVVFLSLAGGTAFASPGSVVERIANDLARGEDVVITSYVET